MFTTIKYSVDGDGIAVAVIDVPNSGANVMSPQFRDDVEAVIAQVEQDDNVKGLVITSAKSDFMAGADLKMMVEGLNRDVSVEDALEIATMMTSTLRKLETFGKPVVAAVNGAAMGGGCEVAIACHARVISDSPKAVLALPEVQLGLMPGAGGTQRLPRLIGIKEALPVILQGIQITGEKALSLGLATAVIPASNLVAAAKKLILEAKVEPVQPWDKKGFRIPGGSGFFNPEIGNIFNFAATSIAGSTQRNLPAPIGALTAVARGTATSIDQGAHIEACEFAKLVMNPVAVSMVRTLFVSKGDLEKLKARPVGVEPAEIKTVGVVGAGLMGSGVALVSAQAGFKVVILDATQEQANAGKKRIADLQARLVAKGRAKQEKVDAALGLITATADYASFKDCDLIIEAVFEDPKVKVDVFRQVQAVVRTDTIIATNTSAIPITLLSDSVKNPERFIGMHFFSPVDRMALLEIIKGGKTSERTLAHSLDYAKILCKTPIVVNDGPGFFTTRLIGSYINEAIVMVSEGVSPVLIDNAAKAAGYPVGPLQMSDELTLELSYRAHSSQHEIFGDEWIKPVSYDVLHKFCTELNRKGRRYGAGFYDYEDDKRLPWKGISDIYPQQDPQPDVEELKTRMLFVEAMEAAHAFEEGRVTDPAEGDVGALLGIGFPAYTGGVFSMIDSVGINKFVETCDRLADTYGERFRPSAWLRDRAKRGERFYPRTAA